MSKFATAIISWQRRHGRKGLPWQGTRDPYRIWLSEVMLQQTQVSAVIPYYERFLERFPNVAALAAAPMDEVLRLWSGLGYYARGRNLHAAARRIAEQGQFPSSSMEIAELPGVGRSTAAAIAAFAFGERAAILDGNVKRVLARFAGIEGWPGAPAVQARLWELAERLLPENHIGIYTQALMDLGATVCTRSRPRCSACPVRPDCVAYREGRAAELPSPRPRGVLPTKSITWLVLQRDAKLLFERRPPSGIWGGLWCFPERDEEGGRYPLEAFGYALGAPRFLESIEHGFTHFRLKIRPVLFPANGKCVPGEDRAWMTPQEASAAAVPKPVRVLLGGLPPARRRVRKAR